MLKRYMNMLNMDANSFYPMIISIMPILGGIIKSMVMSANQQKKRKIFEMYYKRENDSFYVIILAWEIASIVMGIFLAFVVDVLIKSVFYSSVAFTWEMELLIISSAEINCILLIIMVKRKFVKKRLLGDAKGRKILACSIIFMNMVFVFGMLNEKWLSYVFAVAYYINEVVGLFYFQGRYIKYDFSSMKIYLDNGEKVACEHIEKAKRKRDFIVIEDKNTCTIVMYDKIEKVEYYGSPKYILTESAWEKFCKKFVNKKEKIANEE